VAYIALASAKGSPGVTTAVAALAATWPVDRDLLVVEIDPAGGDLVVRFDLATEPGLVTLAAAGRRELTPETLLGHTQALPAVAGEQGPSRRVLVAPVSAEQAAASLSALRGGLARALDHVDADVLVDCGRLDPASAAFEVAMAADLLVMVARPVVAEVHHLSSRLGSIKHQALSLLLVGDKPYSVSEVAQTVGANPLGTLPADARAAAVLTDGHPNAVRVLRRSRLLRDAVALSDGLATWLGPGARSGSAAAAADASSPTPTGPPAQGAPEPSGSVPASSEVPSGPVPAPSPAPSGPAALSGRAAPSGLPAPASPSRPVASPAPSGPAVSSGPPVRPGTPPPSGPPVRTGAPVGPGAPAPSGPPVPLPPPLSPAGHDRSRSPAAPAAYDPSAPPAAYEPPRFAAAPPAYEPPAYDRPAHDPAAFDRPAFDPSAYDPPSGSAYDPPAGSVPPAPYDPPVYDPSAYDPVPPAPPGPTAADDDEQPPAPPAGPPSPVPPYNDPAADPAAADAPVPLAARLRGGRGRGSGPPKHFRRDDVEERR
jgi:MinD-like ATPase involved in chromosome partitioning or flagellar assembly